MTVARAETPTFRWAVKAGGGASDSGNAIAADAAGNSYVTGHFSSTNADFSGTPVPHSGVNDIFVAKYDSASNLIWVRKHGGSGDDSGNGIALDTSGNIYVTGNFSSTADFGITNLTATGPAGNFDIFVAKFDNAGNPLWARQAGGTNFDAGSAIAVDTGGNCYVTGFYQNIATFDTVILTNGIASDIFVAKYDTAGQLLWARQAGGTASDIGRGISVDASSNCFPTGLFSSPIATFDFINLTNNVPANRSDIFMAKYDTAGNLIWAKKAGGTDNDNGFGSGVDAAGYVYFTGFFGSTNGIFGTIILTNHGSSDIYVAKYDSDGNALWVKNPGGTKSDVGRAISLDAAGNSYVAGQFSSTNAFFGSFILTNLGSSDVVVAKYDTLGNALWAKSAGGSAADTGLGIGRDAANNLFVTGTFTASANFSTNNLSGDGLTDIFVARLDAFPPTLNIARSGSQAILFWPVTAAGFVLESLGAFSSSNVWSTVPDAPVTIGDQLIVTNSLSGSNQFFRLRAP